MQGFAIVFFAVHSMARDPGAMVRLTLLPWIVALTTVFALFELMAGLGLSALDPERMMSLAALSGSFPALVASFFVLCLIAAWVGLSWHRHILLKEAPVSVLSRQNPKTFGAYFDAVMKFGLLTLVIVLMIKSLMIPLVPVLGLGGPGGKIVSIGINALLISLVLRHGLVLPGAAIGRPISMEDSWRATRGYSGPIYAAAFFIVLFIDLAGQLPTNNLAATVLQFLAGWAGLMLSVGVLTVIYGVRIQGRRMIL